MQAQHLSKQTKEQLANKGHFKLNTDGHVMPRHWTALWCPALTGFGAFTEVKYSPPK
jgi:hypothetical protein